MSLVSVWRWNQEDYSTGWGLDSRRFCILLCFLIFLELQEDLHSGNEMVLMGFRGQLISCGNLELSHLGLCMSFWNEFYFWQRARQVQVGHVHIFSSSKCVSRSVLYKLDTLYWVVATTRKAEHCSSLIKAWISFSASWKDKTFFILAILCRWKQLYLWGLFYVSQVGSLGW